MRWLAVVVGFFVGVAVTLVLVPSNHVVTTLRTYNRTGDGVYRDSVIGCGPPILQTDDQTVAVTDGPRTSEGTTLGCAAVARERFRWAGIALVVAVLALVAGWVARRRAGAHPVGTVPSPAR